MHSWLTGESASAGVPSAHQFCVNIGNSVSEALGRFLKGTQLLRLASWLPFFDPSVRR